MRERGEAKKKKLSQYISRDYSLRVYRHEQIRSIRPRDEHGNSNDTIFLRLRPRGPLFTRLYETFAYDESRTITIQSPSLGFVCILSSPRCFSLYIRPWPSNWIRRLAILLPLAFLIWILFYSSNLYSSFSPFFFRTRITRIFVRCVTRLAIGVRCIASIIVLHVFAIAKSITCHKCVVAAHFEALCETCLIMVNV